MVRDEVEPNIQRAISLSMIALFAGIAFTGVWSFASGLGNMAILLASFVRVSYCVRLFYYNEASLTRSTFRSPARLVWRLIKRRFFFW
jgi:hypothetical protein